MVSIPVFGMLTMWLTKKRFAFFRYSNHVTVFIYLFCLAHQAMPTRGLFWWFETWRRGNGSPNTIKQLCAAIFGLGSMQGGNDNLLEAVVDATSCWLSMPTGPDNRHASLIGLNQAPLWPEGRGKISAVQFDVTNRRTRKMRRWPCRLAQLGTAQHHCPESPPQHSSHILSTSTHHRYINEHLCNVFRSKYIITHIGIQIKHQSCRTSIIPNNSSTPTLQRPSHCYQISDVYQTSKK